MTEQDRQEERVAHFEVTVRLPEDGQRLLAEIDLDVLIAPPEMREQGLILAIATFDEIDQLVSVGAEVTIRSKVPDSFPQDQIATEEEVRARVEKVTRLAEKGDS